MTAATDLHVYAPEPLEGTKNSTREGQPTVAAPTTEDVSARFLQFLIPAAATVASTFGPQLGQAIGGLVGGSQGAQTGGQIGGSVGGLLGNLGGGVNLGGLFGRSLLPQTGMDDGASHGFVPPLDITGPMVQECTFTCLGKLAPDLATMLNSLQPQLAADGGGSRSAEAELAALERSWPDIASFVTSQVAQYLPDAIKAVTGSVIPLLGTRDATQFTPLLTGTEAHARWFVPVLNTVLTAVQQNLPALLQLVGGGSRAPRDTSITWTDLSVYGRFWDNDFVRVVAQENAADSGSVELVLELAPHLSWAKQIQVRDDNGSLITRLHVQDAKKSDDTSISADQILTNGSLLLAKAKMFGIMTGMYVLPTAGLEALRGKRTHIRWMSD